MNVPERGEMDFEDDSRIGKQGILTAVRGSDLYQRSGLVKIPAAWPGDMEEGQLPTLLISLYYSTVEKTLVNFATQCCDWPIRQIHTGDWLIAMAGIKKKQIV